MKKEISRETFYGNGNIHQRFTYKKGTPIDEDGFPSKGLREYFYENGQLMLKGNYKNNESDGLWEVFDEEGNLTKSETWENGKLIE